MNPLYHLQPLYNKCIRPYLPRTVAQYNGVNVRDGAILDQTSSYPNFESESISFLQQEIEGGDDVVIIGGGRGVTAVHAAWAGARSVTVYEAAREQVDKCRDTITRNGVEDTVSVKHALVASGIDVWGDSTEADTVGPEDLPSCDVMEMDCEGTETEICRDLGPRPRSMVIECHPCFDSPKTELIESLPGEYTVVKSVIDTYDDLPTILIKRSQT